MTVGKGQAIMLGLGKGELRTECRLNKRISFYILPFVFFFCFQYFLLSFHPVFGQRPQRGPEGTLVLCNRGNFVRTSVRPPLCLGLTGLKPGLGASSQVSEVSSQVSEASSQVSEASSQVSEASSQVSEASSQVSEASSQVSEASSQVSEA